MVFNVYQFLLKAFIMQGISSVTDDLLKVLVHWIIHNSIWIDGNNFFDIILFNSYTRLQTLYKYKYLTPLNIFLKTGPKIRAKTRNKLFFVREGKKWQKRPLWWATVLCNTNGGKKSLYFKKLNMSSYKTLWTVTLCFCF